MSNKIEIKELTINARIRRYAILIPVSLEKHEILSVIQWCSDTWGGYETYFIPYDDDGILKVFRKILREFDPDNILKIHEVPDSVKYTLQAITSPFSNLGEEDYIEQLNPLTQYPHIKITNILKHEDISCIRYFENTGTDDHNLLFFALTGIISTEVKNHAQTNKINIEELKQDYGRLFSDIYNIKNRYRRISESKIFYPLELTQLRLIRYFSDNTARRRISQEPPKIVVGNALADFIIFFNLFRYNENVFWLPTIDSDFSMYAQELFYFISQKILYREINTNIVNIVSVSLDGASLKSSLEEVYLSVSIRTHQTITFEELPIEKLNIQPQTAFYLKRDNPEKRLFEGQISSDEISALRVETLSNMDPSEVLWLTEVQVKGYNALKKSVSIEDLFSNRNVFSSDTTRVSKNGVIFNSLSPFISSGYGVDEQLVKSRIHFVDFETNLRRLFTKHPLDFLTSNQGKYMQNMLKKLGNNLSQLANYFKSPIYTKVFALYVDSQSKEKGKGILIDGKKRRYIDYSALKTLILDEIELNHTLDELINKKILLRGFMVKCDNCLNADWYSIATINDTVICTQCYEEIFFSHETSRFTNSYEPEWFYKLDEVFFKGVINNIHVPILTLNYLKGLATNSFEFLPEIDIYHNNVKDAELDIICNIDGDLVIGEAKKPNSIQASQISKYKWYAKKLNVSKVVFSCMDSSWDSSTNSCIERLTIDLGRVGIEVLSLYKEDLLDTESR